MIWSLGFTTLSLMSCSSEPTVSQCEAVCDWAVSCHVAARDVDEATLLAECLTATYGASDACDKANNGELNAASFTLLQTCVAGVEGATTDGRCDSFTGSIDQIKTGTPLAECLPTAGAIEIFEAAKDATNETSEELCTRLATTFCDTTAQCILGDFQDDIPKGVTEEVGGTPDELCLERLDPVFTADCIADDLYAPETGIDDLNTRRQAARECLEGLSDVECASLFAGNLDPLCAGMFADPGDLVDLAQTLLDLSDEFADAASSL